MSNKIKQTQKSITQLIRARTLCCSVSGLVVRHGRVESLTLIKAKLNEVYHLRRRVFSYIHTMYVAEYQDTEKQNTAEQTSGIPDRVLVANRNLLT